MGGVEVESEEAATAAAGGTEAAAAAMSPIMARLLSSDDAVTGEAPRLASSSEARWLRSLELMVDVPRNAGSETATWAEQLRAASSVGFWRIRKHSVILWGIGDESFLYDVYFSDARTCWNNAKLPRRKRTSKRPAGQPIQTRPTAHR